MQWLPSALYCQSYFCNYRQCDEFKTTFLSSKYDEFICTVFNETACCKHLSLCFLLCSPLSLPPSSRVSILGMHLFGCRFGSENDEDTLPDRKNFDSLLWAIVTVFQVRKDPPLLLNTHVSSLYYGQLSCIFTRWWVYENRKVGRPKGREVHPSIPVACTSCVIAPNLLKCPRATLPAALLLTETLSEAEKTISSLINKIYQIKYSSLLS